MANWRGRLADVTAEASLNADGTLKLKVVCAGQTYGMTLRSGQTTDQQPHADDWLTRACDLRDAEYRR